MTRGLSARSATAKVATGARALLREPPVIVKYDDGTYCISSRRVWLPGSYADERAARYAFRLDNATLDRLQKEANARKGGPGGVITYADLRAAGRRDERTSGE